MKIIKLNDNQFYYIDKNGREVLIDKIGNEYYVRYTRDDNVQKRSILTDVLTGVFLFGLVLYAISILF